MVMASRGVWVPDSTRSKARMVFFDWMIFWSRYVISDMSSPPGTGVPVEGHRLGLRLSTSQEIYRFWGQVLRILLHMWSQQIPV